MKASRLREHVLVILGHLALTLLLTWPLVLNFGIATPGFMLEDRDQNLWNLWWVSHAIGNLQNPYHTTMLYQPDGVSLYFHTLHPLNGLFATPLIPILGLVASYNIIVVLSFVLTGWFSYMLIKHVLSGVGEQQGERRFAPTDVDIRPADTVRQEGEPPPAPTDDAVSTQHSALSTQHSALAFVASVAFTYSAFHLSQLRGIMQLISLEWLPFYLLFLLRLLPPLPGIAPSRGRTAWRDGGLAGLGLLLLGLTDWYYTMYALLFTAAYLLYLLLAGWRGWLPLGVRDVVLRAGGTLLLGGLLLLPIVLPMLGELGSAPYINPSREQVVNYSADLAAFALPMRDHPLLGDFSRSVRDQWPQAANQYEVYLGFSVLVLAIVGLFNRRARPFSRFLAIAALICLSLALGPVLHIGGVAYEGVPMPYRLFDKLPLASISRSPDRFTVLVTLCLAMLLAFGLQMLTTNSKLKTQNSKLIPLLALILIVFEFLPIPYRLSAAPVPTVANWLARETGSGAVLELPQQEGYWGGGQRMRFQTAHGKPIFGGYISREYAHPFVYTTPGFAQLELVGVDIFDTNGDEQLAALNYYHVGHVVLYAPADPTEPKQARGYDAAPYLAAINSLFGPATPAYSDTWAAAWAVPSVPLHPFLALGDGWYDAEVDGGVAHRWMSDTATLRAVNPFSTSITATLSFSITTLESPRPLRVEWSEGSYQADVPPALTDVQIPIILPPGESSIKLISPTGSARPSAGGDKRRLSFSVLHVRLERLAFVRGLVHLGQGEE